MRVVLGLALLAVMGLVSGSVAQDKKDAKIDGKKLVGKWSPDSAPKEAKATIEFTKDNKLVVLMTKDGAEQKITGTYKLTGDKLALSFMKGDETKSVEITVTKLTDEVLEGEAEGRKETFTRVKEKKERK